jgi:hypothetical protein
MLRVMQIEEGRFLERPCPHCGRTERRAFGEVESPRGELASYALGWTSEHDDPVGHLTIGIGAGNPGGGSFHIEYRLDTDPPGMRLVDRPFEDVPEGGPDLTREEALAHEDLPFVWFVADNVVLQDRRAWWMRTWLAGTRAFVTAGVAEREAPVCHVIRTSDDEWQLFERGAGGDGEPHVVHLFHAVDHDPTLVDVLDLEPGERADRPAPGAPWTRGRG